MALIIALICFVVVNQLQIFLYQRYWNKNLGIELRFQSHNCVEGDKNLLEEVITNNKHLPLPILHVMFRTSRTLIFDDEDSSAISDNYYRNDIFSIKGMQIVTRHLAFTCSKRGCYTINGTSLISADLFMIKKFYMAKSNDSILHVYPKKIAMTNFEVPYKSITGQYISNTRLMDDPFEFRSIRKYQPYDNMRSINWKSSAKNNELLVNTFYTTASREVKLLLNLEKHTMITDDDIMEIVIRIASTLTSRFINDNIPLSIETNGYDLFTNSRISNGPGSSYGHIEAIDRSLARLDLTQNFYDFMDLLEYVFADAQSNNTYYIMISNNRKPDLLGFYNQLKSRQIPIFFIIPTIEFTEHIDIPSEDIFLWEVSSYE